MSKIKELAKKAGAVLTIAVLTVAMTGAGVFATVGENVDTGGTGGGSNPAASQAQTGVNNVNPGANTNLEGMIATILNVVFSVIGIVAVVMIVIGGVNYTLSQGDTQKIQKAKNTILYGIVGLVIVLLAFAIVNFVLSGLMVED